MINTRNIVIRECHDPLVFDMCADLMAATDPWITLGMDKARCRLGFEGLGKEVHVAWIDEMIAGFTILQTAGSFRGYIQTLCTAPRFRGSGVGTQLLQYCEERVSAYSPNLFICVSEFNKGALKLYLNFGFKQVGSIPDFVKEGYTELLLRKTRGPLVRS